MYTIYDIINEKVSKRVETWEELIEVFRSIPDCGYYADTSDIAHNKNDLKTYRWDCDLYKTQRRYIIFDEFDRIINKADIEEGIKEFSVFVSKDDKYLSWFYRSKPLDYEYRKSPIPFTGVRGRYGYYRTIIKKNKLYYSRLQDWIKDHPEDSRIRKLKHHVIAWNDDFNSNKNGKSWKKQKKRKQWMKNH